MQTLATILTVSLAAGNLSARYLVLTPTEHPISRMSLMMTSCEYFLWCSSIAFSQFPRTIWLASSREEVYGIARLIIDIVAASASAAACCQSWSWNISISINWIQVLRTWKYFFYFPFEREHNRRSMMDILVLYSCKLLQHDEEWNSLKKINTRTTSLMVRNTLLSSRKCTNKWYCNQIKSETKLMFMTSRETISTIIIERTLYHSKIRHNQDNKISAFYQPWIWQEETTNHTNNLETR